MKPSYHNLALSPMKSTIWDYIQLMRLDKPIGIWLLLWPTLTALWLAQQGRPSLKLIIIFTLGVIVMRSAGCVINDIADKEIDKKVKRTQSRPLAQGRVSVREALLLFGLLIGISLGLVLFLNKKTLLLSGVALLLAGIYPLMKRVTFYPQFVLGMAFSWAIPMCFTALNAPMGMACWLLYGANLCWTFAYDTIYALSDKKDDLKIGVKSSAIGFGQNNRQMIALLQSTMLVLLLLLGILLKLTLIYYLALLASSFHFIYQHEKIKNEDPDICLRIFKQNHWVGLVILLGVILSLQ